MSLPPEKTMHAGWLMVHEETVYEQYEATVDALMASALGPDRLVVAGHHEQEIIKKVVVWLRDNLVEFGDEEPGWAIADAIREKFGCGFSQDGP